MGPKFQKWSKRAATQFFFILSESPGNSETFGTKKILVRGGGSYRRLKFVDYYHSQLSFKQSFLNEIWLSIHENDRKDKAHKRLKNF